MGTILRVSKSVFRVMGMVLCGLSIIIFGGLVLYVCGTYITIIAGLIGSIEFRYLAKTNLWKFINFMVMAAAGFAIFLTQGHYFH